MPYIYLSKVNYNSKIYDVYNKKIDLKDILNEVFDNLGKDQSLIYDKVTTYVYEDSKGNKHKNQIAEKYFFNELEKNETDKTISGYIIRQYPRYMEVFDENLKKMVSEFKKEACEIYFYFDVTNELIGFCTRNKFGYNQFNDEFKNLLQISCPNHGFEVFLKKDPNKVQDAIKNFKRIEKIIATIIPPNANSEINDLLNNASIPPNENISKAKLEYVASNLNENGIDKQGKLVQNLIKTVSSGYGDLNIHGKYNDDSDIVFKSNKDAPITTFIDDDSDKSTFISKVKMLILNLIL